MGVRKSHLSCKCSLLRSNTCHWGCFGVRGSCHSRRFEKLSTFEPSCSLSSYTADIDVSKIYVISRTQRLLNYIDQTRTI